MIKHLLYNFRVVINNHSVLKALKEAICSVLLLVIVLPSIIYAGKDCCVMQNDKKSVVLTINNFVMHMYSLNVSKKRNYVIRILIYYKKGTVT
ncbi:type IV secretion system domain protein [Orientia tsutsugamushi str. UT76]|nr:type IV secretion system domain protein [Orientia tsutsugamushi str. UT76]